MKIKFKVLAAHRCNLHLRICSSLRADSTYSLTRSEVPPPVESAHKQDKAFPKSRVVHRLEEPDLIGRKRSLLFSFSLID